MAAGAVAIHVSWSSMKDRRVLAIRDDERGVFPQLDVPDIAPSLFPPGPLASLEVRPRRSIIALEGTRRLRARPLNSTGREIDREVELTWTLRGPGSLDVAGRSATHSAPGERAEASVTVIATEGGTTAEASATVSVSEAVEPQAGSTGGVPEPEPVSAPTEDWRARASTARAGCTTRRIRTTGRCSKTRSAGCATSRTLAQELVLRNFGEPAQAGLLERMVQVLTYVDNQGAGKGRG